MFQEKGLCRNYQGKQSLVYNKYHFTMTTTVYYGVLKEFLYICVFPPVEVNTPATLEDKELCCQSVFFYAVLFYYGIFT